MTSTGSTACFPSGDKLAGVPPVGRVLVLDQAKGTNRVDTARDAGARNRSRRPGAERCQSNHGPRHGTGGFTMMSGSRRISPGPFRTAHGRCRSSCSAPRRHDFVSNWRAVSVWRDVAGVTAALSFSQCRYFLIKVVFASGMDVMTMVTLRGALVVAFISCGCGCRRPPVAHTHRQKRIAMGHRVVVGGTKCWVD